MVISLGMDGFLIGSNSGPVGRCPVGWSPRRFRPGSMSSTPRASVTVCNEMERRSRVGEGDGTGWGHGERGRWKAVEEIHK